MPATVRSISSQASLPGRPTGAGLWAWLTLIRAVRRQRRALAALPPERLDDIGLTPEDVARETARATWDVPSHWLR